jgi:mRNA interferase RelE/StbE
VSGYSVTFAASARREFRDLPSEIIDRIIPKIRELAATPRPIGCKKLQGYKDRWRIRVGQYGIVYAIDDARKIVDITRIAHRREAYEPWRRALVRTNRARPGVNADDRALA